MVPQLFLDLWPTVAAVLTVALSALTSGHAVLWKRDNRSAVSWVGLIWLVPIVGAVLYVLLGINRITRKAHALKLEQGRAPPSALLPPPVGDEPWLDLRDAHLVTMAKLGGKVTRRPLLAGNRLEILDGGAKTYPAMLEAIRSARTSLTLCTYIFDRDPVGEQFALALGGAVRRGVEVRVLVDAVGVRYSRRPIHKRLRREGVRVALFMPSIAPARLPFLNLRNHRKIMVADGRVGFTGGMNIRDDFMPLASRADVEPAEDLHFRVEGPVVRHLQDAFAEDWVFTTGEALSGEKWFPTLAPVVEGEPGVHARGIIDGPDESFDVLRWVMLGALASARRSVRVVTPYFLPDTALVTGLNVAALRGVEVDIVLPERGNLPLVQWASTAQLWQNLERGCRIHLSRPPFDHTKLMIVDEAWVLLGSANWDPRSLRLNFEFCVEAYDRAFAAQAEGVFRERLARSRPITREELDARPFPVKLRDGVARLFAPYL